MRALLSLTALLALPVSACAVAAPSFAPSPRQAFVGFVGINPPRADVPVGALWIEGYGPVGDAASPDNVETVRSLNGLTIDKNLQLSLNLALFDLLGVDPKARDHFAARFTDLSIVRVKDVSGLTGPKGEPRIVEALKAGTVTVSSDSEFGLTGQKLGFETRLDAAGIAGSTRTHAIEARDMFVAIRVARYQTTQGAQRELRIGPAQPSIALDGYTLGLSREHCPAQTDCQPNVAITKHGSGLDSKLPAQFGADGSVLLELPVPMADGKGGLFTALRLTWLASCTSRPARRCRNNPRLLARYEGARLVDLHSALPARW